MATPVYRAIIEKEGGPVRRLVPLSWTWPARGRGWKGRLPRFPSQTHRERSSKSGLKGVSVA